MSDRWTPARPLTLSVNVMYEMWGDGAAPGLGPMGNPLRPGVIDTQARSWAAYGAVTGIERILDILDRLGVRAVIYTSGLLGERQPALVRRAADAGHAVAAHGWSQDILPAYLDEGEERASIARCAEVLQSSAGERPRGWLSPRCTPSTSTTALLAEQGFHWHADAFDKDLPEVVRTPAGPIVDLPFTVEINDLPLAIRYGNEPEAFTRMTERLIAAWEREPLGSVCADLTVHAHVFGRPQGAIELARALSIAKASPAVELTHHGLVAGMVLAGVGEPLTPFAGGVA